MKNIIKFDSRYLGYAAGLIIFCDSIAAPLRFFLEKFGLGFAAYIPKLLGLVVAVIALFFQQQPKVVVVFLISIFFSALVGLVSDVSFFSMGFALFLFSPFFVGIFTPVDELDIEKTKFFLFFVFLITIIGVALDYFIQFPWEGVETEVMGVVVETSREWTNFSVERLAGFTRLSTAAAFYISISALFLYFLSGNFYKKVLIITFAVYFVYLTTNKTALAALVLIVALDFLFRIRVLQKYIIFILMFFSVVFPLWAVITFDFGLELSGEDEQMMFASFNERLQVVWPLFFDGIRNVFVGNGLGGVGSPAKIDIITSGYLGVLFADNTFLYVFGWLGVFAVYIYFVYSKTIVLFVGGDEVFCVVGKIVLFIFLCGIATDMLESVLPSYLLGIVLRQYSKFSGVCNNEK